MRAHTLYAVIYKIMCVDNLDDDLDDDDDDDDDLDVDNLQTDLRIIVVNGV